MTQETKQEVLLMGAGILILGLMNCLVLSFLRPRFLPVLYGTGVGCLTAWIYFILLGVAVEHPDKRVLFSLLYLLRFSVVGVMVYWVLTTGLVDPFGALIPLLFPRLVILFRVRRGKV